MEATVTQCPTKSLSDLSFYVQRPSLTHFSSATSYCALYFCHCGVNEKNLVSNLKMRKRWLILETSMDDHGAGTRIQIVPNIIIQCGRGCISFFTVSPTRKVINEHTSNTVTSYHVGELQQSGRVSVIGLRSLDGFREGICCLFLYSKGFIWWSQDASSLTWGVWGIT